MTKAADKKATKPKTDSPKGRAVPKGKVAAPKVPKPEIIKGAANVLITPTPQDKEAITAVRKTSLTHENVFMSSSVAKSMLRLLDAAYPGLK